MHEVRDHLAMDFESLVALLQEGKRLLELDEEAAHPPHMDHKHVIVLEVAID